MSPFPRTKLTLYAQKYFMMEDSIEMFLQDENCKLSNPAQEKPVVTAASGALLMGFYGLWTLFALPGFRKVPVCLKVPYLPSSRTQTQNVMKLLHGRAGSLADLGSGDGRLVSLKHILDGFLQTTTFSPEYMVFAAAVAGFECTGFEINSILNGYARVKGMWKGIPPSTASFINQDYWKTNLSKYNNVTVFLAPGVMEVLGRKLEMELSDEARVIACRFPFPDWTPTAIEGEGLDQTWAYDMRTIQKLSSQPATK
ncbi:ATP synthase subunit C lysine N-methyltransferase isoform X2 [Triplophysa dalaica]|uniref:ATP synthase subunit C lysine N-methyltransferase isoform X2 n=1 Tax=Triplophysa dalaica TaxID=1582913 RepID=UPI0024E01939|nr:ATP synthase subunit C lysine N-methyltransferase isoform X2 [Triplophysa dalaica]